MDRAYLGKIERGEILEPGIDILERIARDGLGLPVAAIAPPGYYSTAQLVAARDELSLMPSSATVRSAIDFIEDQIKERRQTA